MAIKPRVEKLEARLGTNTAHEQVFILPGVRIAVLKNSAAMVIYSSELVSAAFVDALLQEQFSWIAGGIILPDNHMAPSLCEQLGCPEKEQRGETYA